MLVLSAKINMPVSTISTRKRLNVETKPLSPLVHPPVTAVEINKAKGLKPDKYLIFLPFKVRTWAYS